ncbi:ankyrin repeat domain-containing protein [Paenibacillus rhizovicinus]|uniref:Ankyrin repeat domain-containing protein n=1 Tax=Paenibacillus rhizovicinus TaxID=2704463 RepID=A0A6C0NTQ4_9BACL|nr:ankyrin repeat domain-containing protein [Paenibacillus rhizovicinus]QHW29547.1 ankyrin repeat domain-containing protein [Paenibacillus rhizovicinus]
MKNNCRHHLVCSAVANGDIEYVSLSLSGGADPNAICENGRQSLLIIAVENEQNEMIHLLLLKGADINAKSYGGWTPLHAAVDTSIDGTIQTGGNPGDEPTEIIRYLLENGADRSILNNDGQTPLDIAKDYKSMKIIDYLETN